MAEVNIPEEVKDTEMEICSICGNKVTLFGTKDLKNGKMCRNCAKLVSPWLTDEQLANMSKFAVKLHLINRGKNYKKLQKFVSGEKISGGYNLFIDDKKKKFIISKKEDYLKENADVCKLTNITSVELKEEEYQLGEGVDLFMEIILKNMKFEKIRFRLNEFPAINKDSEQYTETKALAEKFINAFKQSGVTNIIG